MTETTASLLARIDDMVEDEQIKNHPLVTAICEGNA